MVILTCGHNFYQQGDDGNEKEFRDGYFCLNRAGIKKYSAYFKIVKYDLYDENGAIDFNQGSDFALAVVQYKKGDQNIIAQEFA